MLFERESKLLEHVGLEPLLLSILLGIPLGISLSPGGRGSCLTGILPTLVA